MRYYYRFTKYSEYEITFDARAAISPSLHKDYKLQLAYKGQIEEKKPAASSKHLQTKHQTLSVCLL